MSNIKDTNYKIIRNHKNEKDTVILNNWALVDEFFVNMENSYDMRCLANTFDMAASELLAEISGSDANFTKPSKEDEKRIKLFRWHFAYKAVFIKESVEDILSSNDTSLGIDWLTLLTKKMRSGVNLARTGSQLHGYYFDFYDEPQDYDALVKTIAHFVLKNPPSTHEAAVFLQRNGIKELDADMEQQLKEFYTPRGLVSFASSYGYPDSLVQTILELKDPDASIYMINDMDFGRKADASAYYEQVRQIIKEHGDPDYAIRYITSAVDDKQRLELMPLAKSKDTLDECNLTSIFGLSSWMNTKELAMPFYDMVLKAAQDNPKVAMDWIDNIDLARSYNSASDVDPNMKEIVLNCNDPYVAYRYCRSVKAEPKMQNVIVASGDAWLALKYAQNINPNKKMLGVILNSDNKDIALEHYNTVDKYKEELKEVVLG